MSAAAAVEELKLSALAPMLRSDATFYRVHLILPLLAASALLLLLERIGGNRWIADQIFALGDGHWLLKKNFVTSRWIHPGGKYLCLGFWFAALILWWRSRRLPSLSAWRGPLAYLLWSTLLATCLVSALKLLTHMDCPWDIQGYGGLRPYFGLFDMRPAALRASGCFPSGHASAGYAWVALYFFFASVAPRWRFAGLRVGLLLGAIFGISQQLRGAHFASHDVAALLLCWLTALILYIAVRRRWGLS